MKGAKDLGEVHPDSFLRIWKREYSAKKSIGIALGSVSPNLRGEVTALLSQSPSLRGDTALPSGTPV